MPTVLRFDGFRVVIYPNDHGPPHVHLIRTDAEAIFFLNCPDGPATLRQSVGFTTGRLNSVAAQLSANVEALCDKWSRIHGDH